MYKVEVYIETDSMQQSASKKKYGFVLYTIRMNGEPFTRQYFGEIEGTYHQAVLKALIDALIKIELPCEVTVYSKDAHVLANLSKRKAMIDSGFKDSKGNDIRNVDMWKKVCEKAEKHGEISVKLGKHEYSTWLLDTMRRM